MDPSDLVQVVLEISIAVTVVLFVASLVVLMIRSPAKQQWIAEKSIGLALVWLMIAMIPMERYSIDQLLSINGFDDNVVEHSANETNGDLFASEFQHGLHQEQLRLAPKAISEHTAEPVSSSTDASMVTAPDTGLRREHNAPPKAIWSPNNLLAGMGTVLAVGSIICIFWLIVGWRMVIQLKAAAQFPESWLQEFYDSLPQQRRAQLRITDRNIAPVSTGLFQTYIILPAAICRQDRKTLLRSVLLHEQTHIDRHDAFGHLLTNLALPILWMHPLYWLLRRKAEFARELIADDRAAANGPKSNYVKDLMNLLKSSNLRLIGSTGVLGMFRVRSPFSKRMQVLMERDERLDASVGARFTVVSSGLIALFLLTAVVIGVRPLAAGNDDTADTGEPAIHNGDSPSIRDDESALASDTAKPNDSNSSNGATNSSVRTLTDKSKSMAKSQFFHGWAKVTEFQVAAATEGIVQAVLPKRGQTIKKGNLLVQLENLTTEGELLRSERNLALLSEKLENKTVAEIAKTKLDAQLTRLERLKNLHAQANVVSESELDRQKFEVTTAKLEYAKVLEDRKSKKTELELAAQDLKSTQAAFAQLNIISPTDGVVESIQCHPGSYVKRGDPICTILVMDKVRVYASIPDDLFNPEELREKTATLEFRRARNQRYRRTGKITFVSNQISENHHFTVIIECENESKNGHWMISPGSTVLVSFEAVETDEALSFYSNDDPRGTNRELSDEIAKQEVKALEALVNRNERIWKRIQALYEEGAQQGDAASMWQSRANLDESLARLSMAKKEYEKAFKHYKKAVMSFEKQVQALEAQLDAGTVTLDFLIDAQSNQTRVELQVLKLKRILKK